MMIDCYKESFSLVIENDEAHRIDMRHKIGTLAEESALRTRAERGKLKIEACSAAAISGFLHR